LATEATQSSSAINQAYEMPRKSFSEWQLPYQFVVIALYFFPLSVFGSEKSDVLSINITTNQMENGNGISTGVK
jgi:hypothetical protein